MNQEQIVIDPMAEVKEALSVQLNPDDLQQVKLQAAIAEAWQSRVAYEHRTQKRLLAMLKRQMLLPKSKDYTDMDRTIQLEAAVADQQALVDILSDYANHLATRITLAQSLIKSLGGEMRAGLTASKLGANDQPVPF